MRWAKFSKVLTDEARASGEFLDPKSRIGIRMDGTRYVRLGKLDWNIQYERVFERDKSKCQKCGNGLTQIDGEIDHVIPRGRGGDDSLLNLQLLGGPWSICKCHRGRKGSKHA